MTSETLSKESAMPTYGNIPQPRSTTGYVPDEEQPADSSYAGPNADLFNAMKAQRMKAAGMPMPGADTGPSDQEQMDALMGNSPSGSRMNPIDVTNPNQKKLRFTGPGGQAFGQSLIGNPAGQQLIDRTLEDPNTAPRAMTGTVNGQSYTMTPGRTMRADVAERVLNNFRHERDVNSQQSLEKYKIDQANQLVHNNQLHESDMADKRHAQEQEDWRMRNYGTAENTDALQKLAIQQATEAAARQGRADRIHESGQETPEEARQRIAAMRILALSSTNPDVRAAAIGVGGNPNASPEETALMGKMVATTPQEQNAKYAAAIEPLKPHIAAMEAEIGKHTMRYGYAEKAKTQRLKDDIVNRGEAAGMKPNELARLRQDLDASENAIVTKNSPHSTTLGAAANVASGGLVNMFGGENL
jgi:hypothetical protein